MTAMAFVIPRYWKQKQRETVATNLLATPFLSSCIQDRANLTLPPSKRFLHGDGVPAAPRRADGQSKAHDCGGKVFQ
jgi:hypothetical protein